MPDLNSVPPSPHILAGSPGRQAPSSQEMPPPPPPPRPYDLENTQWDNFWNTWEIQVRSRRSIPNPTPSRQDLPSPVPDNTGVGLGPGPLRHPRPPTTAELYLELEREQEATVNRLSAQLSMLRAANSSSSNVPFVPTEEATTTTDRVRQLSSSASSSASEVYVGPGPYGLGENPFIRGRNYPLPNPFPPGNRLQPRPYPTSYQPVNEDEPPHMQGRYTGPPIPGWTGATPPPINSPIGPYSLSRSASLQSASGSSRRSSRPDASTSTATSTPASPSETGGGGGPLSSPSVIPATSRYEEATHWRRELEKAKRENEMLKEEIRRLDGELARRAAAAGRE